MQQARQWQRSPDFDRFRKERQTVEHRIARMVQLGMRQARYCGRRKTLFQALLTATVANLTLIAGRMSAERHPGHPTGHLTGSADAGHTLLDVLRALGTALSGMFARQRHARRYSVAIRPGPPPSFTKAHFRPQF